MASYRSSDAACAPPESQKAAADDVYVVALDYECPDRDLCRPDQYLDFQHKFDWKKRTLLQIYKHNEPWQWTPNDLERINLMKDYTKIKEADVWGMPEMVKSMPPFKAIVFKYPWTGADVEEAGLGKDNLEKAMRMLPQSITVVDFGDWVLTPGVAFQRFLTSRIVSNTVTFLALKGISLDLFDKLRRVQFSLVTKVLTIAMLPCDYEIREYLHVIPNRIRFDGKNSTAYYAELGDSVKIRAYADQEPCRTVYLVEPALVALHSRRQLLHINTLDLTKDLGSYLDRLLGHLVNNVTVELALVVSTVIWPNMPSSNSGQRSTSADARGRGTAAYGEGSSTSFEAWDKAFTILARRYPRLEVLRIIITDLRVFAVEDETSYAPLEAYLTELESNVGRRGAAQGGLLSAASALLDRLTNLRVQLFLHPILQILHLRALDDAARFPSAQLSDQWNLSDPIPWEGRVGEGTRYVLLHADHSPEGDADDRMFFNSGIQIAECLHPSIVPDHDVPLNYKSAYDQEEDDDAGNEGAIIPKIAVRKQLSALEQQEWSSYAILHYNLRHARPCFFTDEEWSVVDEFSVLVGPPLRENSML